MTIRFTEGEKAFHANTLFFNSTHNAVLCSLEVLGCRNALIPVFLSVNSSPEVLAGVLHAGGGPVLVDIDPNTLQMSPGQLKPMLEEFGYKAIVIFDRSFKEIDPALVEIVQDKCPTIVVHHYAPMLPVPIFGDFCIYQVEYDFSTASLTHQYTDGLHKLFDLREGPLGYSAEAENVSLDMLTPSAPEDLRSSLDPYLSIIPVKDVDRIITYVSTLDQRKQHRLTHAIQPLHRLEAVRNRFAKSAGDIEFPVADELYQRLLGVNASSRALIEKLIQEVI